MEMDPGQAQTLPVNGHILSTKQEQELEYFAVCLQYYSFESGQKACQI